MTPRPERTRPGSSSPLKRAPLTASVEPLTVGASPSDPPATPESVTARVPESVSHDARESARWRTFVRKEARLRGDQVDALAQLRRRLSGARADRSETITDNTLIRIAVDLLLQRAGQMAGDSEDELAKSILQRTAEE